MNNGFSVIVLLSIFFYSIISCNKIYQLTHRRFPIPNSFNDTINCITARLEQDTSTNYIIYSYKSGNCFGSGFRANAKIYWVDDSITWCRNISKPINKKRVSDVTLKCANQDLFFEFEKYRIDTVKSFPKPMWGIDPSSPGTIKIHNGIKMFETIFEMGTFYCQDTSHFKYNYFQKIMNN